MYSTSLEDVRTAFESLHGEVIKNEMEGKNDREAAAVYAAYKALDYLL